MVKPNLFQALVHKSNPKPMKRKMLPPPTKPQRQRKKRKWLSPKSGLNTTRSLAPEWQAVSHPPLPLSPPRHRRRQLHHKAGMVWLEECMLPPRTFSRRRLTRRS
eukprot:Lithocolla_globosa_v1_NODE_1484_length_2541_cov_33.131134.p2 type:complete len:105 gc:universal NODE_1484_length_2541_cov_33.131134:2173-2487(+)